MKQASSSSPVLDNGSEIRELLLDAEQTCQVTGIDLAKAKEMAANALDQSVVVTPKRCSWLRSKDRAMIWILLFPRGFLM